HARESTRGTKPARSETRSGGWRTRTGRAGSRKSTPLAAAPGHQGHTLGGRLPHAPGGERRDGGDLAGGNAQARLEFAAPDHERGLPQGDDRLLAGHTLHGTLSLARSSHAQPPLRTFASAVPGPAVLSWPCAGGSPGRPRRNARPPCPFAPGWP